MKAWCTRYLISHFQEYGSALYPSISVARQTKVVNFVPPRFTTAFAIMNRNILGRSNTRGDRHRGPDLTLLPGR